MSRLLPKILLTAFAAYVVWDDMTAEEPVSTLGWLIDAVIVGLAAISWLSLLRKNPDA
jgi:hypothetical protein